jgi:hypothetical protein
MGRARDETLVQFLFFHRLAGFGALGNCQERRLIRLDGSGCGGARDVWHHSACGGCCCLTGLHVIVDLPSLCVVEVPALCAALVLAPEQAIKTTLQLLDVVLELRDLFGSVGCAFGRAWLGSIDATRLLQSLELELFCADLVSKRVELSVDLWPARDDRSVMARFDRAFACRSSVVRERGTDLCPCPS